VVEYLDLKLRDRVGGAAEGDGTSQYGGSEEPFFAQSCFSIHAKRVVDGWQQGIAAQLK
jgi:hypothetical protein